MASKALSIMGRKSDGNRWIKDRGGFEEDILLLSDDASILYDSAVDLMKGLQNFTKAIGEDEKKHPYGKASRACQNYASGMKTPGAAFTKASEQFANSFAACQGLKEHIRSTVLAKMISFKETDCKECDQLMTLLKKTQNEYKKKKSSNIDPVLIEAAEQSLKKLLEEAKSTLATFNKTGIELMNVLSTEMKAGFDKYCETGA